MKASRTVKFSLSLILAAALLYLAFRGVDWKDFFACLGRTDWWMVTLSMAAGVVALVFRAERWRLQLVRLDPDIKRKDIWHGSNIGNFCSIVIPGSGEFYRCGHVSSKGTGATYDKVLGTIVMERTWDVAAIAALLVAALLSASDTLMPFMRDKVIGPFRQRFDVSFTLVAALLCSLVIGGVAAVILLRGRSKVCARICGVMRGMVQGFAVFGRMPRKWLFLLYTAGIWMMYILMMHFTFLAIPDLSHLGLGDSVFISAVGNIASVIPTPGNLGAYHYLVGMALSSIYIPAEAALGEPGAIGLLAATVSHGSHAILIALLALISWIRISFNRYETN